MRPHKMRTRCVHLCPGICRDTGWRADVCVPMLCGPVQRCVQHNIAPVVAEFPGKGNHPAHCFPPGPSRTVTACDFSTTHYWDELSPVEIIHGQNADVDQALARRCGEITRV